MILCFLSDRPPGLRRNKRKEKNREESTHINSLSSHNARTKHTQDLRALEKVFFDYFDDRLRR